MICEYAMNSSFSRRGFGTIVFLDLSHHRRVISLGNNTTRLKTIGLLSYSNEECAFNSSCDCHLGER